MQQQIFRETRQTLKERDTLQKYDINTGKSSGAFQGQLRDWNKLENHEERKNKTLYISLFDEGNQMKTEKGISISDSW